MSKKRSDLSAEDRDLFRKAVKDSQPMQHDKHKIMKIPQKTTIRREIQPPSINAELYVGLSESILGKLNDENWIAAEDFMHFEDVSISSRTLSKLKRGQLTPETRLDLHGLTGNQALAAMSEFIRHCQAQSMRHLLIVHGKGRLGQTQGPILKNLVYYWLREQPEILAFCSAQPKDGGRGAAYVLLRGKKD